MTNDELKRTLEEMVMDVEELEKIIVLEGDEFADAVIGLTDDYRLVYSYEKITAALMNKNGWTELETLDYIEANTLRSLPYMESLGNAPIIINELWRN